MSHPPAVANPVMLSVHEVRAGYGESEVLHGISLNVHRGETVVLLGPNGHGKTTLLRAISGLIPTKGGVVSFQNYTLTNSRAELIAGYGLVHIPQGDLLYPEMSVLDNLLMGAYQAGAWPGRHERLESVFEIFPRLGERQRQLARTLSGGERRMLALGRGLMGDGAMLMIDEPSLGLAPIIIDELYDRIAAIKAAGRTILLVEESATHIERLADRVYLIEDGSVVFSGTPGEVLAHPSFAGTYLGLPETPSGGNGGTNG